MAIGKSSLTQERLKELLRYNPETGEFIRLVRVARQTAGKVAGSVNNRKAVAIWVDKVQYLAHRLAWLYMTGSFPELYIDHINRDSLDNRWANLRMATHQQNMFNRPGNKGLSNIKGVYWNARTKRWYIQICYGGKIYSAGTHTDLESAAKAAQAKRIEIHQEFACHG